MLNHATANKDNRDCSKSQLMILVYVRMRQPWNDGLAGRKLAVALHVVQVHHWERHGNEGVEHGHFLTTFYSCCSRRGTQRDPVWYLRHEVADVVAEATL